MFIIASLVSYWLTNYGVVASLFVSVSQTPFFLFYRFWLKKKKKSWTVQFLQELNDWLADIGPVRLRLIALSLINYFHSCKVSKHFFHHHAHFHFFHIFNKNHNHSFPHDSSLFYLKFTVETLAVVQGHHDNNESTVLQTASYLGEQAVTGPEISITNTHQVLLCVYYWLQVILQINRFKFIFELCETQ